MRATIVRSAPVFMLSMGAALGQFVFQLLVARRVGATGSGDLALAVAVAMIAGAFARVGLEFTVVRLCATELESRRGQNVITTIALSIGITSVVAVFLGAVSSITAPWIARQLGDKDLVSSLNLMFAALPFVANWTLLRHILTALKRPIAGALLDTMVPALAIAAYAALPRLSIDVVPFVAYSIGSVGAVVLGLLLIFHAARTLPDDGSVAPPPSVRSLLQTSWPLFQANIAILILSRGGVVVASPFLTTAQLGVFNIAGRLAAIVQLFVTSIFIVGARDLAAAYHRGNPREMMRIASDNAALAGAGAFLIFIIAIPFNDRILSIFGQEFEGGYYASLILLAGLAFNAISGPMGLILTMTEHNHAWRTVSVITVVLTVAGIAGLSALFGITGAAAGQTAGLIASNSIMFWVIYRYFGDTPLNGLIRKLRRS